MRIADVMSKEPITLRLENTLLEAAEKMKDADIGCIPVTDGRKIKGMLTDRDIVTRGVAFSKDPATTLVKDLMTEKIAYVFADEDVSKAASLMQEKQIRRLVVVDKDKQLVGVISFGDISWRSGNERLSASIARCVAEPTGVHAVH